MGTQLNAVDLETLRGIGPETGSKVWDPLELAQWAPLDHLRKAELANGRSAMLAVVGWSFPTFWTFEGPVKTTDPVKAFLKADMQWWAQFIIFCAVIEGIKYGRLAMIGMAGYLASILIPGSVPLLH